MDAQYSAMSEWRGAYYIHLKVDRFIVVGQNSRQLPAFLLACLLAGWLACSYLRTLLKTRVITKK